MNEETGRLTDNFDIKHIQKMEGILRMQVADCSVSPHAAQPPQHLHMATPDRTD
jgi:hypothetical protein